MKYQLINYLHYVYCNFRQRTRNVMLQDLGGFDNTGNICELDQVFGLAGGFNNNINNNNNNHYNNNNNNNK